MILIGLPVVDWKSMIIVLVLLYPYDVQAFHLVYCLLGNMMVISHLIYTSCNVSLLLHILYYINMYLEYYMDQLLQYTSKDMME